jgi:two-component system, NarL family, sensor kinase
MVNPLPRLRTRPKFLLWAILPLIAALALISIAVMHQQRKLSERERVLVESAYMSSRQAELRHYVELAHSIITRLEETGLDDQAQQREAVRLLAALDYGRDGYFFLYDMNGLNLMHPRQPELMGQNLWEMRDVNGFPVIQALISAAKEGGGYVRYVWQKPSSKQVAPKLGYVIGLPKWNWMLGTGIYLDDVDATLAELDRQISDNVATTLWWIAGVALLGIAVIGGSGMLLNLTEFRIADAKLKLLARQVVKSQEDERAHLSRELHDSTSQTLVSIKLLVESSMAQIQREQGPLPAALPKALGRLNDALLEVRNISHRLRPAELDVLGLPAALERLGHEFSDYSHMAFSFKVRGALPPLPDEVNTVLFRITQEALTNIEKHAAADHVTLRLMYGVAGLRLKIIDDGVGFNVQAVREDPRRGIGLRNVRERIESIGGEFSVVSKKGRTELTVNISANVIEGFKTSPRPTSREALA